MNNFERLQTQQNHNCIALADSLPKYYLRYQTKTPLQFGKYVGAYIDDGLNDPIFLELAKTLHQALPRIMKGHDLKYMWAYKYDSEWSSGINLHADQAGEFISQMLRLLRCKIIIIGNLLDVGSTEQL